MWTSPAHWVDILCKNENYVHLLPLNASFSLLGYDKAVAVENKGSQVCGKLLTLPRPLSLPLRFEKGSCFIFHRGVENLSTLSRGIGREKKGEISQILANFGEITKILNFALCKTSFFPHAFPQAVEKGAGSMGVCLKGVENPLENYGFSTRGQ